MGTDHITGPSAVAETSTEPSTSSSVSEPASPIAPRGLTASDLLAHEAELERQAREAVPFSFRLGGCTYEKGYIRQPVWACKTCGGGGVCAGCGVGCHSDHDLVELFAKRNFRCDCGTLSLDQSKSKHSQAHAHTEGTTVMPKACNLRPAHMAVRIENEENQYGRNFEGKFCRCQRGERYDPLEEDETMFQCLVCEDWFHESCTSLLGNYKPPGSSAAAEAALRPQDSGSMSRAIETQAHPTPVAGAELTAKVTEAAQTVDQASGENVDTWPLIAHDSFDLMICSACVRAKGNEVLRHYVGTKGWGAVIPLRPKSTGQSKELDMLQMLPRNIPHLDHLEGTRRGCAVWGLELNEEAVETLVAFEEAASGAEDAAANAVTDTEQTADMNLSTQVSEESDEKSGSTTTNSSRKRSSPAHSSEQGASSDTRPDNASNKRPKVEDAIAEADKVHAKDASTLADTPTRPCTLPPLRSWASERTDQLQDVRPDVFLAEDFRDNICRCAECLPRFSHLPFLLEAESTYSPPRSPSPQPADGGDNDDARSEGGNSQASSSYDLGLAALRQLPRERMMQTLEAYTRLRDALFEQVLRPHQLAGTEVDEKSIRDFFDKHREGGGT
ncbi:Uncharacterized conserved protein, contains N-recognin-type Zn-finger [Ceraceosorus bombacis]|uniref:Uncharacterized conserved protein, contains N-recognin-type Zn-finger n=1 Tax=Ceraceosorus bombacis TaxID=401625 RepID=A0A0P1BP04_9BASI|nr:Uncharacterized conserved protein, contains N-recognin-type Zn-finger [Ceraceosorus bombacis]